MRRKMTFFQFWEQPEELIMSSNQQKFVPSHPTKFRSNSGLSGLQNARVGLVLPPLGTEVFRHFTTVSLEEIQQQRGVKINKDDNMEVTQKHPHAAGDLESGKPLPSIYGDPPPEFVNTPLEDLDPFYQSQKTFLVLSKGKTIYRFNADPACYLLSPFNLVRTTAIKILLHSFFRLFILLTVVSNCVLMTTVKPPAWSKSVVYGILAVYAFEMLIKVVARGLCLGRFTFLRNPWNWLDVMVIATVYLTVMVDLGTLSVFQVLPALKIIPLIPGLKATVGVLVESLKKLSSITILTIFFLSSFAVIALQLFMGKLRQKCVLTPTLSFQNLSARDNFTSDFDFHEYINNQDNHYYPSESNDALLCGNTSDAGLCPEGYVCLKTGRNPNYGYTSYDSFGWAFLALFRLMTLDFWENLLELTLRADGKIYAVFFVVVIVLVSYHLVALIVAVMAMAYAEQRQDEMAEAKQKSKEYHAMIDRREASGSAYPSEKHHQKIRRSEEASADEKSQKPEQTAQEEPSPHSPGCHTFTNIFLKWNCCGCWQWCKMGLHRFVMDPFFDFAITVCVILNTVFMAMEHYPMMHRFESVLSQAYLVFTAIFTAEVVIKLLAMGPYFFFQEGWNIFDSIIVTFNLLELVLKLSMERLYQVMRVFKLAKFWSTFNILMKTTGKSVLALSGLHASSLAYE